MQGSSAVLHQGRKLISCKDKKANNFDNFSIERQQILKQKVSRSRISTKHSRHERGKIVLAIRRLEIVRRRVRLRYFFNTFFTSACAGCTGCGKGHPGVEC